MMNMKLLMNVSALMNVSVLMNVMTFNVMKTTAFPALMVAAVVAADHDVTGTWQMNLEGDHVVPVALVLKQSDSVVTGTITLPTQNAGQHVTVDLTGKLIDGKL